MCQALRELMKDEIAESCAKSEEKGRAEGRAEGEAKGIFETLKTAIHGMKSIYLPDEEITKALKSLLMM